MATRPDRWNWVSYLSTPAYDAKTTSSDLNVDLSSILSTDTGEDNKLCIEKVLLGKYRIQDSFGTT